MNFYRKTIILFLCFLLVTPALFSCVKDDGNENLTDDTTEAMQDVKTYIVENGISEYKIVYPENPSSVIFTAAQKLRNEIKTATGAELKMQDDFIQAGKEHDDNEKEILVGLTNHKQVSEATCELNAKDYVITKIDEKIIITGTNDTSTTKAVNYFVNNLINENIEKNTEDKASLLFEAYTFYDEYSVESFTVGGVNLREFTIIYSATTDGAKEAAEELRERISEKCGYTLNVSSDEATLSTHEILVGNPNRSAMTSFNQIHKCNRMEYKIGEFEGQFIIASGGAYSLNSAVKRISTKYLNSGKKQITIATDEILEASLLTTEASPVANGTDLRVMTANIMAEMSGWSPEGTLPINQRIEIFASVLQVYSPDVAGVQEVTANWSQAIFDAVGDEYEFIYRKTPDNLANYSTIIYKKDKYTVIDKGLTYYTPNGKNVIRLVTWALLEDNTTKERFGIFNTHWTPHSETEKQIHANENAQIINNFVSKYNVPVFSTADYNTIQDTSIYNKFLSDTSLLDAMDVARSNGTLINDYGGCGTVGVPHTESKNRIDHIFISNDVTVLGFETVVGNDTYIISDHSPKYVDIKFN